ncbi:MULTISPECIES: hypothetical protein [unclassified Nodularia (in: cyanobacteria)]|uniref:hypothetical protein n=1 Tax=unclassified Nodularia (in: cyanobacteria) TaxID=2656917 RepID=UPI0022391CEA|nr:MULTISPECIES: hypothetical protein [unclassified Nodularia (in: cyanobacteria)]
MGRINGQKSDSRTEEGKYNLDANSRGRGATGSQGQDSGNQQERVYRTNSQEFNFRKSGRTVTGGMLCQLIEEWEQQLAVKKLEVERLESRINEFRALQEELDQKIQENP